MQYVCKNACLFVYLFIYPGLKGEDFVLNTPTYYTKLLFF